MERVIALTIDDTNVDDHELKNLANQFAETLENSDIEVFKVEVYRKENENYYFNE